MPAISEQEFEEIFQRNKTVMSSAISRAVQDAGAGEYDIDYITENNQLMCTLGHKS